MMVATPTIQDFTAFNTDTDRSSLEGRGAQDIKGGR